VPEVSATLPEGATADDVVHAYVIQGLPYRQVAAMFDISKERVSAILHAAGVTPRRRGQQPRADLAGVVAAYRAAGVTTPEVGAQFGCHAHTVARLVRAAAEPVRQGRRPVAVDHDALVAAYRTERLTIRQCADRFGLSYTATRDRLIAAEALSPGRHAYPPGPDPGPLVDAYVRQGLTITQCAARFGMSYSAARNRLVAAGVPLRPRGRRAS
jgi:transposase